MVVTRTCNIDTELFLVDDIISFTLSNGEHHEAIAIKQEDEGMLFILRNCLQTSNQMNSEPTNKGGYAESMLRRILTTGSITLFPDELRSRMIPVYDTYDLLRIPTEKEILGYNAFAVDEPEHVTQFEAMKNVENRKAMRVNLPETYWLTNDVLTSFVVCAKHGFCEYTYASNFCGVRPIFKLKNI